jgi:3-phenylpropionate/cinnamic acid dioxygenase small subunit
MRRIIGNVEIVEVGDDGLVVTTSNFVLHEFSIQATDELRVWAGRATHRLRRGPDGFRIEAKVVELVNGCRPIPTLAFLL